MDMTVGAELAHLAVRRELSVNMPPDCCIDCDWINTTITQDVDEFFLRFHHRPRFLQSRYRARNEIFPLPFNAQIEQDVPIVVCDEKC